MEVVKALLLHVSILEAIMEVVKALLLHVSILEAIMEVVKAWEQVWSVLF